MSAEKRAARRAALEATFKSMDTEEWLDIKFTRPCGYASALFFRKLHVHPNVVTVISIVLGVLAAYFFYHFENIWYTLAGILSLMVADILDSADGQLARMTGQKTLWGRLLDGFAGDIWFFSIYFSICLRLTFEPMPFGIDHQWGVWIWVLAFISGIFFHKDQAGLSDYYRNIYLKFLLGKSELNDSRELAAEQKVTPWRKWFWKIWLFFYQRYTVRQERCTPQFQQLRDSLDAKWPGGTSSTGEDAVPMEWRQEFCRRTKPLLKWTNVLTFNCRAIALYVLFLLGQPWVYFLIEMIVFQGIFLYMKRSHERICREMA